MYNPQQLTMQDLENFLASSHEAKKKPLVNKRMSLEELQKFLDTNNDAFTAYRGKRSTPEEHDEKRAIDDVFFGGRGKRRPAGFEHMENAMANYFQNHGYAIGRRSMNDVFAGARGKKSFLTYSDLPFLIEQMKAKAAEAKAKTEYLLNSNENPLQIPQIHNSEIFALPKPIGGYQSLNNAYTAKKSTGCKRSAMCPQDFLGARGKRGCGSSPGKPSKQAFHALNWGGKRHDIFTSMRG